MYTIDPDAKIKFVGVGKYSKERKCQWLFHSRTKNNAGKMTHFSQKCVKFSGK
jgi:hypothetical protein